MDSPDINLREMFESDEVLNATGCRLWRWLEPFNETNRKFLLELMERDSYSTEQLVMWLKRKGLAPPSKSNINAHRKRLCTCPEEHGGRRI